MVAPQAFKVLTEFKFEIGSAVIGANLLTNTVNKISTAADQTLISFQRLGIGAALSLGVGTSSLIGVLTKALFISDRARLNQLSFANILSANLDKLSGPINTFNERLIVSEKIMRKISDIAKKFALPEEQLIAFTKLIAAPLLAKGLAGPDLQNALDLSRNLLKSAPALGIEPALVQGQLIRAIEGGASLGDTLFRRLVSETRAFQPLQQQAGARGVSQAFNILPAKRRLDILGRALGQFASDTEVLTGVVDTINGQLQRFQTLVKGTFGILRKLGDAIKRPIIKILKIVNNVIETDGERVFNNLSNLIRLVVGDLENFIVTLIQLREVTKDLEKTQRVLGVLAILTLIIQFGAAARVLQFLGVTLKGVTSIFKSGVAFVAKAGGVFAFLFKAARLLIKPLIIIFTIFQILSRAVAFAKLADAAVAVKILAKFTELVVRFGLALSAIFRPFFEVIDLIAKIISPFFRISLLLKIINFLFEGLVIILEIIGTSSVVARAALQGIFFAISEFIFRILTLDFRDLGANVAKAFAEGFGDILERNKEFLFPGDQNAIGAPVINISKIEILNNFKETIQPDRIAFTIKEQILKAAQNPIEGRRGKTLPGLGF